MLHYLVLSPMYLYLGLLHVYHLLLTVPHMTWHDFGKGLTSMLTFMFIKQQLHGFARKRKNSNKDGIAIISSIIGDGH